MLISEETHQGDKSITKVLSYTREDNGHPAKRFSRMADDQASFSDFQAKISDDLGNISRLFHMRNSLASLCMRACLTMEATTGGPSSFPVEEGGGRRARTPLALPQPSLLFLSPPPLPPPSALPRSMSDYGDDNERQHPAEQQQDQAYENGNGHAEGYESPSPAAAAPADAPTPAPVAQRLLGGFVGFSNLSLQHHRRR